MASTIAPRLVTAPTRYPLPYGVLSVVDVVNDPDPHWTLAGVEAETLGCDLHLTQIDNECDDNVEPPGAETVTGRVQDTNSLTVTLSGNGGVSSGRFDKDALYEPLYGGTIEGTPFVLAMYEGCQILGRFDTAEARLREAWELAEPGALDDEIEQVLNVSQAGGEATYEAKCLPDLLGWLEATVARLSKARPLLFIPRTWGLPAFHTNSLVRVGNHLETQTGSLVALFGDDKATVAYATAAASLRRGPLNITGPIPDLATNEYRLLGERAYLLLLDCEVIAGLTANLCNASTAASGPT